MTNDQDISHALTEYLTQCARITASGAATGELSYYPALNTLLNEVGARLPRPLTTIPNPAARQGDFPDIALYEERSQVLTLPVEVKPAHVTREALLRLPQAERYASTFGGGSVLLSNLESICWASVNEDGRLYLSDEVQLCATGTFGSENARPEEGAGTKLLQLVDAATLTRSVLLDPDHIASLLAYHARRITEAINASGDPKDLLGPLADGLKEGLGMHLDDTFFVQTVAQTLTYGLFAAWLESPNPSEFDHRQAQDLLRARIIADLFHQLQQPSFVSRCNLRPRLDAIARTLQWVDWEKFSQAFGEDAIEYFYEPFLAKFDPALRDKLGVWYTPRSIANYQVRRVDHQLREVMGIEDGLLDDSVVILDPATGTGTYLKATLEFIYNKHIENGEPPTIAAAATRRAATTRVIGFEVLPAALVIGHLNIERYLLDQGVPLDQGERLRVYLANSLIGWGSEHVRTARPFSALAEEIAAAGRVKVEEKVLVVIGNPPYEGFSSADTDEERLLLTPWIEPLRTHWGLKKHRMGDLYIRFWRIGVRRIAELSKRGIVSFITNRKWLGGRSFPAMREDIVQSFDDIIIDDLHGDVHDTTHGSDGSIFTTETMPGIKRGVAIATLTKTGKEGEAKRVRSRDFWGTGTRKRQELDHLTADAIDNGLQAIKPTRQSRWKLVPGSAGDAPALDEYFRFFISGVQPVREAAVTDRHIDALCERMREYFDGDVGLDELLSRYPAFGVSRSRYDPATTRSRLQQESRFNEGKIVPFLFKPFDRRFLYWETKHKLLNEARGRLVPYFLRHTASGLAPLENQLSIVASQTPRRPGAARPTVTSGVPGFEAVDPNSRVLPRYRPIVETPAPNSLDFGDDLVESNISPGWISAARRAGVPGTDLAVGDVLFFALVAISHAPSWVAETGTDADDFAKIPLPSLGKSLVEAARVGERISALCDPFEPIAGVTSGRIDPEFSSLAVPDRPRNRKLDAGNRLSGGAFRDDDGGAIYWNETDAWRSVPRDVWEYSVGGFQVLPKWLSYRHSAHGHALSDSDIRAVTHICRRIAAILRLQEDCEELYESAKHHSLEEETSQS